MNGGSKSSCFRKGSFKMGLGVNGSKSDHTVIELGSIDTQRLLLGAGDQRERQKAPTNSLSHREKQTLRALCDTFIPSINDIPAASDESVAKFYLTSASMAGIPDRVGLETPIFFKIFFVVS